LVGMPGSGKSTVGVILAKMLALDFLDTDILIQKMADRTLQQIVDTQGHMALRALEQQALLSIDCRHHVIATGGSAAYSEPAMHHLKQNGIAVFLHADLAALRRRVGNYESRGIAKRPGQSFDDLFAERLVLYEKYADITIESSLLTHDQVCEAIIEQTRHIRC
ncbi:MAG: shikimate kinase, partial [uncultured bacterium]